MSLPPHVRAGHLAGWRQRNIRHGQNDARHLEPRKVRGSEHANVMDVDRGVPAHDVPADDQRRDFLSMDLVPHGENSRSHASIAGRFAVQNDAHCCHWFRPLAVSESLTRQPAIGGITTSGRDGATITTDQRTLAAANDATHVDKARRGASLALRREEYPKPASGRQQAQQVPQVGGFPAFIWLLASDADVDRVEGEAMTWSVPQPWRRRVFAKMLLERLHANPIRGMIR